MEEWKQFHCDLDDLTQWLSEAEDLLVGTCAPDSSLDLEKARTHQLVSVSQGQGVQEAGTLAPSDVMAETQHRSWNQFS